MRIAVTLDADTEQLVHRRMQEQQVSFTQALNDAIRDGAHGRVPGPVFRTRTAHLGPPSVTLDRALPLAGQLEDDDLERRMRTGT
jgi:hypothetical protein